MLEQFLKLPKDRQQYISRFPDGTAVSFHLLSNSEIEYLEKIKSSLNINDDDFYTDIYNICVEEDYKNLGGQLKAGIPKSIGLFIYYHSKNYENYENELEQARLKTNPNELSEYMKNIIMLACSSYKYEDLDNLDRPGLIKLFSRAENLLMMKTAGNEKPYEKFNYKKALRQANRTNKIDFARENFELQQTFGKPKPGEELQIIKQQAKIKYEQRLKRIKGE